MQLLIIKTGMAKIKKNLPFLIFIMVSI